MKGAILSIEKDREETILELFKKGLAEGVFDTLLIPLKVPAGDSFPLLHC